MRYIIYSRVSTKKQSVENQLKDCREYVYKNLQKGDEVIEFEEPDSSTTKPMSQRKKLMEMLCRLRAGDTLVVYKVDRLARDKQELINIYCNIRKMGVEIVGIKDAGLKLDENIICIYAFIACSERSNIQTRTRTALERKRANLERVGATWYGYKLDPTKLQTQKEEAHSFNKPYLLLPDDTEQSQVNLMIDLYQKGQNFGEICRELDAKGYKNRKGNPVHKMTVYRVLRRLKMLRPSPMAQCLAS